jgi:hypothetical protein
MGIRGMGNVSSAAKRRERILAHAFELGVDEALMLEEWDERAAIREFLGGYTRDEAERLALRDLPHAQGGLFDAI